MACCDLLWYGFVIYLLVQLVRLIFADADLHLLFKEKFGKKPSELAGRVVWVTGASSGIGEYLAYELAKIGCKIVLSARRQEELERVKKQCLISGPVDDEDILVLPLDISDFATHSAAVEKVIEKFKQIDVLVNNAGRSQRALIAETSLDIDEDIIKINVIGQISLTKAVLPYMKEKKRGHIAVTSSIAGKIGVPMSAGYSMTKFALHGWFESLRAEGYPDNIGVTMVCPGPVHSEIVSNAFTGVKGEKYGTRDNVVEKRVSTQRCAELMVVSIVNQLDEVWISFHPVLVLTYFAQLFPSTGRWLLSRIGAKTVMKIREGR